MSKICKNPECKKQFDPKSDKAIYCSPACKSRHQYLTRKEAAKKDEPPPQKPIKDPFRPWIEEIELYCLKTGLFPSDLIDFHKEMTAKGMVSAMKALKNSLNAR